MPDLKPAYGKMYIITRISTLHIVYPTHDRVFPVL
jgi:hypothetical protein